MLKVAAKIAHGFPDMLTRKHVLWILQVAARLPEGKQRLLLPKCFDCISDFVNRGSPRTDDQIGEESISVSDVLHALRPKLAKYLMHRLPSVAASFLQLLFAMIRTETLEEKDLVFLLVGERGVVQKGSPDNSSDRFQGIIGFIDVPRSEEVRELILRSLVFLWDGSDWGDADRDADGATCSGLNLKSSFVQEYGGSAVAAAQSPGPMSRELLASKVKAILVQGLCDESLEIRKKLTEWWDHTSRLSQDSEVERLRALTGDMWQQSIAGDWVQISVTLMLRLLGKSMDYHDLLHREPLSDCSFQVALLALFEYSIP